MSSSVAEEEIKKCPGCGLDFWLKDMTGGYCVECRKPRRARHAAKQRRENRDEFNAYHREYNRRNPRRYAPKGVTL